MLTYILLATASGFALTMDVSSLKIYKWIALLTLSKYNILTEYLTIFFHFIQTNVFSQTDNFLLVKSLSFIFIK